jgi:hydrogenase nickel incorporation protein HypA/HybF
MCACKLHSECHARKAFVVHEESVRLTAFPRRWNGDCARRAWRIREFSRYLHESRAPDRTGLPFARVVCSNRDAVCLKKMHELSIAVGLIELAAEESARQGTVRVATVFVRIGPLAGVVCDALRFSFDVAAQGTPVEGARLEIEEVPVTVRCALCGDHIAPDPPRIRCPICGDSALVVGGRELELTALEVIDVAPDR